MIDRRHFLKCTALAACSNSSLLRSIALIPDTSQTESGAPNTNWADFALGTKLSASSYVADPPSRYSPQNLFNEHINRGWQTDGESAGSWVEVRFNQPRQVEELWILAEPVPSGILGLDTMTWMYPITQLLATPRTLRIRFSSDTTYLIQLLERSYFQIFRFPEREETQLVRIEVEDTWPKAGATSTGIGKLRIFPRSHSPAFAITAHAMYDVHDGRAVQAATLNFINPGEAITAGELQVSSKGIPPVVAKLQDIPPHASFDQDIWIPAPFEDTVMEFEIVSPSSVSLGRQSLRVPKYRSYFDGGSFEFLCTNHNDLGWLNTQAVTADFRSSSLILPAIDLLNQYPEFMYSMESTVYLMEFLDRHPEKRDSMASLMRQRRFTWGSSYVQLLQLSAGPERLVRQFYFGRRWLKRTFSGVDTHFYMQTDPPNMSLQMPQILAKAGIKYCLLGRLPFGFYRWQSPDGSSIITRGFHYADRAKLLDPNDNSGWLPWANERSEYYTQFDLPREFVYDYTTDYLPPQPWLVPYVRRENKRMDEFAAVWNKEFVHNERLAIKPPKLSFTTPEKFLDEFTKAPLNITTLYGDWPLAWAYNDEPSNREALLNGRLAHNSLLAAERLHAGLGANRGFNAYPTRKLEDAWRVNIWPDHGWGGNRGAVTDQLTRETYAKSKVLADAILSDIGRELVSGVRRIDSTRIPVLVYNSVAWMRTDIVECAIDVPEEWGAWSLTDDAGQEIPCEFVGHAGRLGSGSAVFVAENVPPVGYRCFFLQRGTSLSKDSTPVNGEVMENEFFRVTFGKGGIKNLFDKQRQWEILRTDKFDGGEVLDFAAPGNVFEGKTVEMQDFDRTANHDFRFISFRKTPIRVTAIREAQFGDFTLRESVHLYTKLDRLDVEIEIVDWNGKKGRELRVAFPLNLEEARISYEVPFGTVEIGKDELDASQLPSNTDSLYNPTYGGDHALPFREAINWIDASSPKYASVGCLAASDSTVHIFRDQTDLPVTYPILQHVLLSTRQSLGWNPEYWYTQEGSHSYRMALYPHSGNWRERYREAIGFNYRLVAFTGQDAPSTQSVSIPDTQSFLSLNPQNLILTAMKKSEDDDRIVLRFYEAEGNESVACIKLNVPIRHACKASLIEEDELTIQPLNDGSLSVPVGAWEIVTLKLST